MTATTTGAGAQARAARIAGAMYLVTMVTAMFVELYVRGSLIVRGEAARTAENIIESERLFRAGIAIDLVTFTGVLASYALMLPMFIYEVTLGFWLLLKGARIGSSVTTSA